MQPLVWYFDFISPFAYIQYSQFAKLPEAVTVELRPILFAGLLQHWKNVGPAEVPPKRTFTYQHCCWRANQLGLPFKMPPAHPFNSLLGLRLAIACDNSPKEIETIFNCIWREGLDLNSPQAENYLCEHLKLESLEAVANEQRVKDQLRLNTEKAAKEQVFGVPSFVTQTDKPMVFWGLDAFDMLLDYLKDPTFFNTDEMKRISNLPEGVQRKR